MIFEEQCERFDIIWNEIHKMLAIQLGEIKFWEEHNCLGTQIQKTHFVL